MHNPHVAIHALILTDTADTVVSALSQPVPALMLALPPGSTRGGTVARSSTANTPAWACPELGDTLYDAKGDIYSFAVVLWEIATRRFPFFNDATGRPHEEKVIMRMVAVWHKRPDEEHKLDGTSFDGLYKELMQRCWAHDPSMRPTASEAVTVLEVITDER